MALNPTPIATTGATHTAQQFRMMIRDLSRANEGITEGDHLKVTALSTPGGGVQIADGSAVIIGRVSPVQGSYSAYNIGVDTSVTISPTGGTGRSDMIVLRVEDPEYEAPAIRPWIRSCSSRSSPTCPARRRPCRPATRRSRSPASTYRHRPRPSQTA
ncbi:hypothetical protein TPA0910_88030 [Streptomyces hygroscopicus subsp. sporocinereus]|uniref:Uncharacterized protein n=1 Tax=Streptomyces hygroscopicus TaxID=1912 RepID=A0ABQ3UFJ2_STRHY|nr:hypothetical protein [Streptomyces hygroscopicus]GHJ34370.1 hypothetical protein TPA0910_88030 [Streptomyces hygroscopicus]